MGFFTVYFCVYAHYIHYFLMKIKVIKQKSVNNGAPCFIKEVEIKCSARVFLIYNTALKHESRNRAVQFIILMKYIKILVTFENSCLSLEQFSC